MFKKIIICLFITLLTVNFSFGNTLLSSKNILPKIENRDYLLTLFKVAEEYSLGVKTDSTIYYSKKTLKLALKLNNHKIALQSGLFYAKALYTTGENRESRAVLSRVIDYVDDLDSHVDILNHHYLLARNYQKEADYENGFKWFIQTYEKSIGYIKSGEKAKEIRYYCKLALRQLAYTYVYASKHQEGVSFYLDKIAKLDGSIPDEIKRCFYSDISYIYSQGVDHLKGVEYAKKALKISLSLDDREDVFQDCAYVGIALGHTDIEESNRYYFKCLDYVDKGDHKLAWVYNDISRNYNYMGKLKESIEFQFKCIAEHEKHKDSLGLTFGYISLGINLLNWSYYEEAEKYLLFAANYFKRKKLYLKLSETSSELVKLYISTGKFGKAKEQIDRLRFLHKKVDVSRSGGLYRMNLAYYQRKVTNQFKKSIENSQVALEFFGKSKDPKNKIFCYNNIANAYYILNNVESAKLFFHRVLKLLKRNSHIQIEKDALEILADIYDKQNNLDSAYIYMRKLTKIENIIFERDATLTMFKKQRDYELQNVKGKSETLQRSNQQLWKSNEGYKTALYGSSVFAVFIGLVLFFRTKKIKKVIVTEKKEKEMIYDQYESSKVQVEKVYEELADTNEVLNALKQELENSPKEQIYSRNYVDEISEMLQSGLVTEEHWFDFFIVFNKIFPEFSVQLNEKFPKLSKNEIKIFALIKLNIPTATMANALMVSNSSLMTARYRLRKKLNLEKNDKLEDLVLEIA